MEAVTHLMIVTGDVITKWDTTLSRAPWLNTLGLCRIKVAGERKNRGC
jgi:hypothetical protein